MRKLLLTLISCFSFISNAYAEEIRFVTCPIYRDTDAGKKSGCWLAQDPATGITYDLGFGINYPDWNYGVLVEGSVDANEPTTLCGGVVLKPVRSSIIDDVNCNHRMLLNEGYPGRRYVLPTTFISTTYGVQRQPNFPDGQNRTFYQFYEFNRSFLIYSYDDYFIEQAALWINRNPNIKKITVVGFAATKPVMISSHRLREDASVANDRAQAVAEHLRRLGVDASKIKTKTDLNPKPIEVEGVMGLVAPSLRRAEIRVEF